VEICPVRLGNRVAFARSLITGQVAQEFDPKGKAAAEMDRLHQFVQSRLGQV
jgi:chromosome partitioning protein